MDQSTYESMDPVIRPKIDKTDVKLFAYGNKQPLGIIGEIKTKIKYENGTFKRITFIVTAGSNGNLIGCKSAVKMGLIDFVREIKKVNGNGDSNMKQELMNTFPKVFSSKISQVKG